MNPLKECAECFSLARNNVVEGMALLHKISTEELWKEQFSSFGEYVEIECQLSKSYASKLVQVWQGYVIEGKVSQRKLESVDAEKLYLALKLPGSIENKLIKAESWDRQELKSELAIKENGEEHDHQPITICGVCNKRL